MTPKKKKKKERKRLEKFKNRNRFGLRWRKKGKSKQKLTVVKAHYVYCIFDNARWNKAISTEELAKKLWAIVW